MTFVKIGEIIPCKTLQWKRAWFVFSMKTWHPTLIALRLNYLSWSLGWIKISPVLIQDLDHNPGVLLWSADIASPVQIVADPIQPFYLIVTSLKVELHSVAWQRKKTPSFFWCPTGLHTFFFYGTGLFNRISSENCEILQTHCIAMYVLNADNSIDLISKLQDSTN
jgi:hypothetical protein